MHSKEKILGVLGGLGVLAVKKMLLGEQALLRREGATQKRGRYSEEGATQERGRY